MPAMIRISDVRRALRPALGSDMVDGTDVAEQAAHTLRSYAPYRDTFETLSERLKNVLFNALYTSVGPSMTVRLDNGRMERIRLGDLEAIADDCMYALFDGLTVYSVNFQNLKDYTLRSESLSALRVLWEKYDAFQSGEEKALMARIIRENYPPERYRGWLPEQE
ncbi:MAG: hypothetical protein IJ507_10155 [Clostridia bacterium]|nr:hypothetical protein [Clostridia bacterium]